MPRFRQLRYLLPLLLMLRVALLPAAAILTSDSEEVSLTTEPQAGRSVDLRIESIPDGAEVSMNGRSRGRTPLLLEGLAPGISIVRLTAEGYESATVRVRLVGGEAVRLTVPLARATGSLRIEVEPEDAVVDLSTAIVTRQSIPGARVLVLPTGTVNLRVSRFGYQEVSTQVSIGSGTTTEVSVALPRASFSVEVFPLQRGDGLDIEATAPGSLDVSVADSKRNVVLAETLSIDSPVTVLRWPGRLPPGEYRLDMRGVDANGTMAFLATKTIEISSEAIPGLMPWSGSPGLMYAPRPRAGNAGFALGSAWAYVPEATPEGTPASTFALSALGAVAPDLDLLFAARATVYEDPDLNRLGFTARVIRAIWDGPSTTVALQGSATVDSPLGSDADYRPDMSATPQGVFLSIPVSQTLGALTFLLSPEAGFSWAPPRWNRESDGDYENVAILGARTGASLKIGPARLGVSWRLAWNLPDPGVDPLPASHFGVEATLFVPAWATSLSPFLGIAGPWGDARGFVGFSAVAAR